MRIIEHQVYDKAIENRWKMSDVDEVHTDFERGEMNAISIVYYQFYGSAKDLTTFIKGCFFINKKLFEKRLLNLNLEQKNLWKILNFSF